MSSILHKRKMHLIVIAREKQQDAEEDEQYFILYNLDS
jgi:hypothetical protein